MSTPAWVLDSLARDARCIEAFDMSLGVCEGIAEDARRWAVEVYAMLQGRAAA